MKIFTWSIHVVDVQTYNETAKNIVFLNYLYGRFIRQLKTIHITYLFVHMKKMNIWVCKTAISLHFPFLFTSVSAFWFQSLEANRWNVNMGMWQLCVWMEIFENNPLWLWVKNKTLHFKIVNIPQIRFFSNIDLLFLSIYFFKMP